MRKVLYGRIKFTDCSFAFTIWFFSRIHRLCSWRRGLISTPALLFLGLPPAAALATNKLAGTMGVLTSTIRFVKSGKVDFRVVGKWFPFLYLLVL